MNINAKKNNEINRLFIQLSEKIINPPISSQLCVLQDLANEMLDGQSSKGGKLLGKSPNVLKNIIDDISFELKTPLANICLASELFESGLLSTEQKMFIDIIKRNSIRISNLISNFNLEF